MTLFMTVARIRRLNLTHFRNYRAASMTVRGDVVVLVGPNGAGKTNCLEAISLLSPGRGLRRATREDVADHQGDGSWSVSAEVEGALGLATLGTGIDPPNSDALSSSRRCRIDREPVGSAAAFGDHLRMVWLTPAMDGLFTSAASERRRFFDRLVLAIDSDHSSRVSALERSLRSRNRLLEVRNYDDHWCDAVEHETAELAVAVAAMRAQTVTRLCGRAGCARHCLRISLGEGSGSTAGWKTLCSPSRRRRWRTATVRFCAQAGLAMPPPAARSMGRTLPTSK